ncbi:EF hand family protein [Trichomonas vaginalis G3]|uniref:EF hand family protein n=1 Tax=Trichomonas vaginalis (strain ATCC PRA-98 / G3) TaxID=412133 RepID=A2FDW9_TRIV3|nr:oxidoreductase activity, acting on NAD(P)H, oxygen as acceptor [Trichomonas vaginalis G3]EAX96887.1 EF hand family protein [Trichomonas vaginalis G3]KAI5551327.1 oxidoreductase activity, acting on NAD(P)H, oxygen as acceptor [Trichomonas vaginalis G3]|eukprot:XP_001309817.1 EF hand family protein [Trichomonas vaginalis G3]
MGVAQSAINRGFISESDAAKMSEQSYFSERQIFVLAQIFRNLTKESQINAETFAKNMKISNKSIGEILYKIIDDDGSGDIDFTEFVEGLNKFHPNAPFDEKVKLCFRAYDSDGSGAVSKEEITDVIKLSIEGSSLIELEDAQINLLVDQLINTYDNSGSGELNYKEFYQMVSSAPGVIECFDINLDVLFG